MHIIRSARGSARGFGRGAARAGVAAMELGLVAPVPILLLVAMSDFSMVYHKQLQLSAALAAGAVYAFTAGQTESGTALTGDVTNFVNTVSAVTLSSVSATYNGGLVASGYYCVKGSPPVYSGPYISGFPCLDGSGGTAGKYISISGSFTYTAIFKVDSKFFPSAFTQTVLVRLQ
jgi:hypothetical protein